LPKIKMFHTLDEGINTIFKIYSQSTERGNHDNITDKKSVTECVFAFIKILAECEPQYLLEQSFKVPKDEKFTDHTLIGCIKNKSEKCHVNMKKYRKRYYAKMGLETEEQVKEMCVDYFRTLIWVFDYYLNGLTSWTHAYNYHYPPLMCDLCNVHENINMHHITYDMDEPSTPFIQLLSVLPTASSKLLPKVYRGLMTGKLYKKGYYPDEFHIDYEGKLKEYQGIPILPFVKRKVITKYYDKVKTEHERDTLRQKPWTFVRAKTPYTYTSKYGEICDCTITPE